MLRVLKGSTDTIYSYPRLKPDGMHLHGVPTAATVRIATPSTGLPDESTWASATIDSVSTTVATTAAEGDTTITVGGSTAFVRGVFYQLADVDDTMIVECAKTVTGTTLYLVEPLPRAFSTSSTVKGWKVSKALTAAQTSSAGNAYAYWQATIGGVSYWWDEPFRIVRRHVVIPLSPMELTQFQPSVLRLRSRYDGTLEELIATAWEMRVVPALQAHGVNEDEIVNPDPLRPMLGQACLAHLVAGDETADQMWRESVVADFHRMADAAFARADWHEQVQTDDPALNPDPTDRRTSIRMSR